MNSEVSGRVQSFGLPPEAGGPAASTASAKETTQQLSRGSLLSFVLPNIMISNCMPSWWPTL